MYLRNCTITGMEAYVEDLKRKVSNDSYQLKVDPELNHAEIEYNMELLNKIKLWQEQLNDFIRDAYNLFQNLSDLINCRKIVEKVLVKGEKNIDDPTTKIFEKWTDLQPVIKMKKKTNADIDKILTSRALYLPYFSEQTGIQTDAEIDKILTSSASYLSEQKGFQVVQSLVFINRKLRMMADDVNFEFPKLISYQKIMAEFSQSSGKKLRCFNEDVSYYLDYLRSLRGEEDLFIKLVDNQTDDASHSTLAAETEKILRKVPFYGEPSIDGERLSFSWEELAKVHDATCPFSVFQEVLSDKNVVKRLTEGTKEELDLTDFNRMAHIRKILTGVQRIGEYLDKRRKLQGGNLVSREGILKIKSLPFVKTTDLYEKIRLFEISQELMSNAAKMIVSTKESKKLYNFFQNTMHISNRTSCKELADLTMNYALYVQPLWGEICDCVQYWCEDYFHMCDLRRMTALSLQYSSCDAWIEKWNYKPEDQKYPYLVVLQRSFELDVLKNNAESKASEFVYDGDDLYMGHSRYIIRGENSNQKFWVYTKKETK